jgi:hypothetical protein
LEKGIFQAQRGFPELSFEEKLEGFLVKLKNLTEERLVESLIGMRLLAEEKMDLFLLRLELLLVKGVIESLVKLKFLLEGKMVEPLVILDLRHAEEKNSPQVGSPMFPLQTTGKR